MGNEISNALIPGHLNYRNRYRRAQCCDPRISSNKPKLCLLGSGSCGKTAAVLRFVQDVFSLDYDPTIEDHYIKQIVISGQDIELDILDTAGQEEFYVMEDNWIRESEIFLVMYSVSSREEFQEVKRRLDKIMMVCDVKSFTESSGRPVAAIVATKCDLDPCVWEVDHNEGWELANKYPGTRFFEVSAKINEGVNEMFLESVERAILHGMFKDNPLPISSQHLNVKAAKK
jgi:GTPase KRas